MTSDPKSKPSRLGRGLSALIGEVEAATPATAAPDAPATAGVTEIPLDQIRRNPAQPRRTFGETELRELADSIRAKGVLQAILVRPDPKEAGRYQIIRSEEATFQLVALSEPPGESADDHLRVRFPRIPEPMVGWYVWSNQGFVGESLRLAGAATAKVETVAVEADGDRDGIPLEAVIQRATWA